jgi:hypothetical protein
MKKPLAHIESLPGIRSACFLALLVIMGSHVHAQQDWEKEGGIPDAQVEIIKDRQIKLPPADRNFDKIPPRPVEPIKPEIIYEFKNLRFNTPDYNPSIRPLKLKQEEISKIFGNYVSAGFGNYASPYLEAYFTSKRDKNKFYGGHFYQHNFGNGPVDDKNSAGGATQIDLFGKAFNRSVVAGGFLTYENQTGYFYGYTPKKETKRDTIKQSYNIVSLGGDISNSKPSDFSYLLKGGFSYLTDNYKAAESEVALSFVSDYKFSESKKAILIADYFLIAREDIKIDASPRNLFRIKPAYQFSPVEDLSLTLGANMAYENDTLGVNKSLHLFPNVKADYALTTSVSAYAALTGDIDKVNLRSLSRENRWINSNINIFNTNRSIEFLGGLKGKAGRKLGFETGFSASNLKGLYFYQNSVEDRSKFDVIYDAGNTKRLNLFAEIGYTHTEAVRLILRGDYYSYSTDKIAEAYHRPAYRVALNSSYNVYGKLLFNLDFIGQGGMKAFDRSLAKTVEINPALDLNFKTDYFLSKQVSLFLKLNNLLSTEYQVYLNYPVRGFQAMGGITCTF